MLSGLRPLRHNEGGIRYGRHSNSTKPILSTRSIRDARVRHPQRLGRGIGARSGRASAFRDRHRQRRVRRDYGTRDGRITRYEALAHARAIVEATDLPVSVDLESGFGATANDVAETYRHAAAAGLVGATIEDLRTTSREDKPLFDIGEATERVAAAVAATRKLGFPFVDAHRARRRLPVRQHRS